MTTLLNIALLNAFTVLPLAVLAFVVGRAARRPALSHVLWVLVLLKFVTPPLFHLPVTIDVPVADVGHVSNVHAADVAPAANAFTRPSDEAVTAGSQFATSSAHRAEVANTELPIFTSAVVSHIDRKSTSFFASTLKTCSTIWARHADWRWLLLFGWLTGSGLWLSWQLLRAIRFHRRVLRSAAAVSELQQQTDHLADALRLQRAPQVLIVNAAVSPMLWGCGSRAKLLFPSDLAERLDDEARATLLTHELAHFARGDHWVRLLELIATSLFWWHPIVWLAKQQIEAAEEECCDAWVVGQFPESPKLYAEALLDTIDYLCERRQALPPVACGLGQAHFLRHRLTKIMRGASPKALTRRGRFATALVAALLLPLQPFVFGSASISSLRIEALPDVGSEVSDQWSEVRDQDSAVGNPISNSSIGDGNLPTSADSVSEKTPRAPAKRGSRGEKVWSTAASPDGRFVVRATTARRIVLTDLSSNAETDLSEERITAVAFAPDGNWFAAAGQDGRVTIWDSARGVLLRTVTTHSDIVRSVAVSPLGDAIAVGSRDGSVLLISLANGELLADVIRLCGHVMCGARPHACSHAIGAHAGGGVGRVEAVFGEDREDGYGAIC